MVQKYSPKHFKLGEYKSFTIRTNFNLFIDVNFLVNRTPIITSVPSEDHTYSAGGATKRPTTTGNGITTVINIGPPENESIVHFNGNNNSQVPSTTIQTVTPIQVQNDTNHVMNTINEVVDNRHSDNISTSSDAAYESSEDR